MPQGVVARDLGVPASGRSPMTVVGAAGAAFAAGAAILVAEFAAVRVGAPWFGQSSFVWANAVGVVLLALAPGYAFGGRIAERGAGWRATGIALALAALGLAAAARLGAPLVAWLAPADVAGDRPLPLSLTGSLAATTLLVGPASFLLAAVAPLLVARLAPGLGAGRAAGTVASAGTLGSLAGAAGTPLLLIPALGARGSLAWAAVACALVALAVLWAGRRDPALRARAKAPATAGGTGAYGRAATAAALVGGTVTVLEFAASRALAPRFGSGNPTWATIVAVVLVTLAAGNAVGGWWAAKAPRADRRARLALLVGAAWSLAAAFLHPGLCAALAPTLAPGDAAITLAGGGVLPAALLLFGVPMLLLGVASPILVRDLSASRGVARAAGAVFAAGTLGSVVGCYLAPLLLLPDVGTRATLGIAALALVAAAVLWPRVRAASDAPSASPRKTSDDRGPRVVPWALPAGAVVTLATLLAALLPQGPLREDAGQLLERETSYQTLRVVEAAENGPAPGDWPLYGPTAALRTRSLRFDEDRTSYQSLRVLDDEARLLTAGRYY
ncbi:MAG TPA: fused MFS/spermidine synthase, partial [Planctomycetota bacterium]|nr:fused MFS/spermidine synthase [Planctomycetota bacterium]